MTSRRIRWEEQVAKMIHIIILPRKITIINKIIILLGMLKFSSNCRDYKYIVGNTQVRDHLGELGVEGG
jgi:hypothetical protein